MKNIRAAVCRTFGKPLTIEKLSLPQLSAASVRVRIMACAVCHSDITFMDGGWGGALPCVFGHEAAGIVVAAGEESNIKIGRRVVVSLLRSCGTCDYCNKNAPALCAGEFAEGQLTDSDNKKILAGLNTGAFAEEVIVHHSQVALMDDDMDFAEASLLACGVLTGWGAVVNTAKVPPGASVAVVGCGGVGANCLQAANITQAEPVVAVDISPAILKLAPQFGASAVCLAGDDNNETASRARKINNGRGFDFVFMAAASARAAELAASLLAPLGALVLAGMPPNEQLARLDTTTIASQQQRILGSKMGGAQLQKDIPALLKMHRRGKLKLAELIASRRPLSQINDSIAAARKGGVLRNVVVFN